MRLVLDTNIVISGLLWNGPPRRLLDAAISGTVDIYTSAVLVTELRQALAYPKFTRRMESGKRQDLTPLPLSNQCCAADSTGASAARKVSIAPALRNASAQVKA